MYLIILKYSSEDLHLVSPRGTCRQGNKSFFRTLCRSRHSVRYLTDVTYVEKRLNPKIINQILSERTTGHYLFFHHPDRAEAMTKAHAADSHLDLSGNSGVMVNLARQVLQIEEYAQVCPSHDPASSNRYRPAQQMA